MVSSTKKLLIIQYFLLMKIALHCNKHTAKQIEIISALKVRAQESLMAVSCDISCCFIFSPKVRCENSMQYFPISFIIFISISKFISKLLCLISLLTNSENTVSFSYP